MGFKFRLEASLRLARQEMDIAQGLLANELRTLQVLFGKKDIQNRILDEAFHDQKLACLKEPHHLGHWQKYTTEQHEKLKELEQRIREQELIVEERRAYLLESKIKCEKFEKLKEKKLKLYYIEELKKEQALIDEIAQRKTSGIP